MLKQKVLLPPEQRTIEIGTTDDGELMLCLKCFAGGDTFDGAIPFSYFSSFLRTIGDLEREAVKRFGLEDSLPDDSEVLSRLNILKHVLVNEFENVTG